MLKNVFKPKKKSKKSKADKINKSNSLDESNGRKSRKKDKSKQKNKTKSKRSQTQPNPQSLDIQSRSSSKSKKKKLKRKCEAAKNDYVLLKAKRKGIIRYIGDVHFANGQWFGIELTDGTVGNHDGRVGNKRYFKTASKCGIFVTYDQIRKVIKKHRLNPLPYIRDSSSATSKSSNRSNSRKKKKKKEIPSISLKQYAEQQLRPQTIRPKGSRPNSAKRFDEFFGSKHTHRDVPPPPPLPYKAKHKHNIMHMDAHTQRNSYSHSSRKSQSRSSRNSRSPQPQHSHRDITEHFNSIDTYLSSGKLDLPLQVSAYSLQYAATGDSNISTELSHVNDETHASPLAMNHKRIKRKQRNRLAANRSYPIVPQNVSSPSIITKHRSQGDELHKHEYGLSLENFYQQLNLNDPAKNKLKYLQNSIRRTQNRSDDLEQILSQTPPSLPATPNDLTLIPIHPELNEHKLSTRFMFDRQRSKSESRPAAAHKPKRAKSKKNRPRVSSKELQSEAEDTDVEDMYINEAQPQTSGACVQAQGEKEENDEIVTRGSDTLNGIQQNSSAMLRMSSNDSLPRIPSHHSSKYSIRSNAAVHNNDEVQAYLQQNFKMHKAHHKANGYRPHAINNNGKYPHHEWLSDESVSALSNDIITPRAVGTDAFSRIRSRSIQNKLAQKKKSMKYEVHNLTEHKQAETQLQRSIKSAKDVCPFWNPFALNAECPYLSTASQCSLKHLSKSAYLDRLSEDDTIELLTVLFVDSLFVESCVVIEKLLEINPDNDEYNTCFGDILEELGRYQDAEKYYKIALEMNPMYDDAHNNYAMMLHHKLNRISEAEQEYLQCLSINGEHQVCHTNYAKLLQHTSRYREAEKHFKKCLKLNEESVNCQHYFGLFLYEIGRWNESKYHLQKAIELTNGNNPSYHYNLAKLLCDLKELTEANQHFETCLKLEPENAAFNFEFALFLAFDIKDIKQSVAYFVKSYLLDPHNALIQNKYNEIAKIVQETGLQKVKRRKSSAHNGLIRGKRNKKKHKTIVEYKENKANIEARFASDNECQSEFGRFLSDNFSFGNCLNIYLKKFKDADLFDIRYLSVIDSETLTKDVAMKQVHAKIMMSKVAKFKKENESFLQWLTSIGVEEYYEKFEQNGILTFESFYYHIVSNADLIRILGDRNMFDAELIWRKCPKYMRQNNITQQYNDDDTDANSVQIEGT